MALGEWVCGQHHAGYFTAQLHYWRDHKGVEVDLVIDRGTTLLPVEIKSARTWTPAFAEHLIRFMGWSGATAGVVLYDGEQEFTTSEGVRVCNWRTFLLERPSRA